MTTVVSLANMPSSPTDVAVNFLNQALLRRRKFSILNDTLQCEYVLASGDPTLETSVLVSVQTNQKNDTIRSSISLRTIQTVEVDDVLTEKAPVVATISWTTPGAAEDTAIIMAMLGTLFGLAMDGVTSKVPNTGIVDALNRGIVDDLYS